MFGYVRGALRSLIPILLALVLLGALGVPAASSLVERTGMRDLDANAAIVRDSLDSAVGDWAAHAGAEDSGERGLLQAAINRMVRDERVYALGLCDAQGRPVMMSQRMPASVRCPAPASEPVADGAADAAPGQRIAGERKPLHLASLPVGSATGTRATLLVAHDMSPVLQRTEQARWMTLGAILLLGLTIAAVTLIVARSTWRELIGAVRTLIPASNVAADAGSSAADRSVTPGQGAPATGVASPEPSHAADRVPVEQALPAANACPAGSAPAAGAGNEDPDRAPVPMEVTPGHAGVQPSGSNDSTASSASSASATPSVAHGTDVSDTATAAVPDAVQSADTGRHGDAAPAARDGGTRRERQLLSRFAPPELRVLARDLQNMLREVESEQRASSRVDEGGGTTWSATTLRDLLKRNFPGDEVIVLSNREPYIHQREKDGSVRVHRPASGLVTAVEPVMRACSGTWIAHGAGSADRESVDDMDRVPVPPDAPSYTLRRIWMTDEEEQGFYYGFSNEGLWPLCHVAHVRPVFRTSDWDQYCAINERFADAVVREARTSDPIVLIQDYHFAMAPAMIRERLPDATIITFWHIPWPNFESFGICPWKEELLQGMLGSDILGFHTPYHCRNFIETVDRFLEARIERESDTIRIGGSLTQINAYPISIAWPEPLDPATFPALRAQVRESYGLPADHRVAIGVDRLDYTKGMVERFRSVERLLEMYPEWIGKFTLIQIAAPSRSTLTEYQRFDADVRALAEQLNATYRDRPDVPAGYEPIKLLVEHHDYASVQRHYRAADVCVVTSLHDGMNLVSKEFVAAHDDERGVLLLSRFAGAAGELLDALIVNPYHVDEVAEALNEALRMDEQEQAVRMRSLRQGVRDFNVFRWAGRLLIDAGKLRRRIRLENRLRSSTVEAEREPG